jgi:hypothetical protein
MKFNIRRILIICAIFLCSQIVSKAPDTLWVVNKLEMQIAAITKALQATDMNKPARLILAEQQGLLGGIRNRIQSRFKAKNIPMVLENLQHELYFVPETMISDFKKALGAGPSKEAIAPLLRSTVRFLEDYVLHLKETLVAQKVFNDLLSKQEEALQAVKNLPSKGTVLGGLQDAWQVKNWEVAF